eukprot:TRINITY_DN3245_c0_g1_i1.p1 TRINITY_DN3245_c0_g1~~TRINITY_DN3245_c0_g1_i1.p1  ORF type:complete len:460 (-),score=66.63 TRINITY_DN3245_c0_g1_i1:947-2326(-)
MNPVLALLLFFAVLASCDFTVQIKSPASCSFYKTSTGTRTVPIKIRVKKSDADPSYIVRLRVMSTLVGEEYVWQFAVPPTFDRYRNYYLCDPASSPTESPSECTAGLGLNALEIYHTELTLSEGFHEIYVSLFERTSLEKLSHSMVKPITIAITNKGIAKSLVDGDYHTTKEGKETDDELQRKQFSIKRARVTSSFARNSRHLPLHTDGWLERQAFHLFHREFYKYVGDAGSFDIQAALVDGFFRNESSLTPLYSFPLFSEDAIEGLLENINKYKETFPNTGPNSMNRYGVIFSDIGLYPFFKDLGKYLSNIFEHFYEDFAGGRIDDLHAFSVEYQPEQQKKLDKHIDQSEVTINVCLGEAGEEFEGGDLVFEGLRGDGASEDIENVVYRHEKGRAVIHAGQHWHRALGLESGHRTNLIVWYSSSDFHKSAAELFCQDCSSACEETKEERLLGSEAELL